MDMWWTNNYQADYDPMVEAGYVVGQEGQIGGEHD